MALTRATDKIIANADGNLNLSGIVTASSFRGDGSQLTGIDASTLKNGSDTKAQANASGVVVTGVLTATSFRGDGSNLTNLPAGLGTALSSDQTSANNKLYYTNRVLSIGSTTTVDHPATASGAYTQYAEIQIEDNADLIIEDGDDLIPDILGLGDNESTGAGGLGRLRVDTITNKSANGAPNFPNGLTGTSGTFTGNLNVGGVLTYEDVTNVDSVGVITARSNLKVGGTIEMTNGTTSINKHSVGIGTTTTAGRNAGVSTATGTIVFNTSLNKVQIYVDNEWKNLKIDVGPLTMNYLVIGGGGAGGGDYRGGGGGAGAYRTNWNNENQGGGQSSGASLTLVANLAYAVVIGAGGVGNQADQGGDGGESKFGDIISKGGGGGGNYSGVAGRDSSGSTGGSSGGGGGANGAAGTSGTYGYNGGSGGGDSQQSGGGGGGAGAAGQNGGSSGTSSDGGTALASTITGSSVLRAGGGGGGTYGGGNNFAVGGGGGAGDGKYGYSGVNNGNPATANTGSGGGGSPGNDQATGGAGGSGIVILRYPSVYTATYTGGVTKTTSTIGSETIDIITATSNTSQTVTFAD